MPDGEKQNIRDTADRLRRQVYESTGGNPEAVKQAEKHVQRAVRELDEKRR